jgi:hypothetical protein
VQAAECKERFSRCGGVNRCGNQGGQGEARDANEATEAKRSEKQEREEKPTLMVMPMEKAVGWACSYLGRDAI